MALAAGRPLTRADADAVAASRPQPPADTAGRPLTRAVSSSHLQRRVREKRSPSLTSLTSASTAAESSPSKTPSRMDVLDSEPPCLRASRCGEVRVSQHRPTLQVALWEPGEGRPDASWVPPSPVGALPSPVGALSKPGRGTDHLADLSRADSGTRLGNGALGNAGRLHVGLAPRAEPAARPALGVPRRATSIGASHATLCGGSRPPRALRGFLSGEGARGRRAPPADATGSLPAARCPRGVAPQQEARCSVSAPAGLLA